MMRIPSSALAPGVVGLEMTGVDAPTSSSEPTTTAVEAAIEGGSGRPGVTSVEGPTRAESDAGVVARAAAALAMLGSSEGLLQVCQTLIRDTQLRGREHDSETRASAAKTASIEREREQHEAEAAAARASADRDLATILSSIGAGLALVVGTVGAIFSGGATLVGAIGLAIAVLGPLVFGQLAEHGVVDSDVSLGISTTCVVVGAIFSFGAGAAGGAASIASQAVQLALAAGNLAAGGFQVAGGVVSIAAAVAQADQQHSEADAIAWGNEVDRNLDEMEAVAADVRDVRRRFTRIAEQLARTAEARQECRRAAMRAFA